MFVFRKFLFGQCFDWPVLDIFLNDILTTWFSCKWFFKSGFIVWEQNKNVSSNSKILFKLTSIFSERCCRLFVLHRFAQTEDLNPID
jgi:hypothetical protein